MRIVRARGWLVALSVALGGWHLGAVAQVVDPPNLTLPVSAVATGDVVPVAGSGFAGGTIIALRLTGPVRDSWSAAVSVGSDGKISYPIRFLEEGMYRLEALNERGERLTMLMISAARHQR